MHVDFFLITQRGPIVIGVITVCDRSVRRVSDGRERARPDEPNQAEESEARSTTASAVHRSSCTSLRSGSISTTNAAIQNYYCARRSIQDEGSSISARTSFQHDSPQNSSKAGVVITSFRQSKRRYYTCNAAANVAL